MRIAAMIKAPSAFSGSLDEFYQQWAQEIILSLPAVQDFHQRFCAYFKETSDPLYLVRMVTGLERGVTVRNHSGYQLRATDNSPAWWIHHLFASDSQHIGAFHEFLETVPCHLFQIRLPETVNKAGWHVAHIFDAKDRNIDFHSWDRQELLRRTARNIHPCNYFYIPKVNWQTRGGDHGVVAFFYEKFSELYRPIWDDFLKLVDGKPLENMSRTINIDFSYPEEVKPPPVKNTKAPRGQADETPSRTSPVDCAVTYTYSRLCFKADMIEPLQMEDKFCIDTPNGTFSMTKQEFYTTFQNVIKSNSYLDKGIYHYHDIPNKALQFKIR